MASVVYSWQNSWAPMHCVGPARAVASLLHAIGRSRSFQRKNTFCEQWISNAHTSSSSSSMDAPEPRGLPTQANWKHWTVAVRIHAPRVIINYVLQTPRRQVHCASSTLTQLRAHSGFFIFNLTFIHLPENWSNNMRYPIEIYSMHARAPPTGELVRAAAPAEQSRASSRDSWRGRDPSFACGLPPSSSCANSRNPIERHQTTQKKPLQRALLLYVYLCMYIFMLRGRKMWEKARKNREAEAHNKSHWRILFRPSFASIPPPSVSPWAGYPGRTLTVADYDEALSLYFESKFMVRYRSLGLLTYDGASTNRECCVLNLGRA